MSTARDFHSPFASIKAARKRHQCTWCGEEIPAGSPYEKAAAVFEGDFGVLKKHPECRIALDAWALAADPGDTYDPGDMRRGSPCSPDSDPCDDCTCGRLAEMEDDDE